MAYYCQCERCGGTMDPGEGLMYSGVGLVCDECSEKLDMEAAYRKRWGSLSKEEMAELRECLPLS